MINFFVEQILIGRITIEDVPTLWRAKVQAKLDELNTDGEQPKQVALLILERTVVKNDDN